MPLCPVCDTEAGGYNSTCDQCGYSFNEQMIQDFSKLQDLLGRHSRAGDWQTEVLIKKRVNDLHLNKYGRNYTKPSRTGWSIRRFALLIHEEHSQTSTDVKLAEKLEIYPELSKCRNKLQANRRLKGTEKSCSGTERPPSFEFEADLQDIIWRKLGSIPELSGWESEGRGILSKGRYDTGEVGEIDLLFKHRNDAKWLVVELKRDQSSDETVGQLLRYMGWVQENLAGKDGKVEGTIICASADDVALQYAIVCVPAIRLFVYSMEEGKLTLKEYDRDVGKLRRLLLRLPTGELRTAVSELVKEPKDSASKS